MTPEDEAPITALTAMAFAGNSGGAGVWFGYADGGVAHVDGSGVLHERTYPFGSDAGHAIACLALSLDGLQILAASVCGAVNVWSIADATSWVQFTCPRPAIQAAFLRDGRYLTVDSHRTGLLWQRGADARLDPGPVMRDGQSAFAFDAFGTSVDGAAVTLVAALDWARWSPAINQLGSVQKMADGEHLAYMDGLAGVSANGEYCYLYWDDCTVFQAETGAIVASGPLSGNASAAALANDGARLLIGTVEGQIISTAPGGAISWQLLVSTDEIRKIALDPTGRMAGWLDHSGRGGLIDVQSGVAIDIKTDHG